MTRLQIVLCGLGGQGILFAAKVLARAAAIEGLDAIASEMKGMSQRRGSVVSFVKLGDFAGPSIRRGQADLAVCLDAGELANALSYVRPHGACVVNARAAGSAEGVRLWGVDAGRSQSANMALLGAAEILPAASCRRAIEDLSPPAVRSENLTSFEKGLRERVRLS